MSTAPAPRFSPREYLEWERAAKVKHEYCRGEIYAMAGGTARHSRICVNLLRELSNQLRGQPCQPFNGDLRIRISVDDRYAYPDASIVCGGPEFEDDTQDVLLNPVVIFEVLSDSTERYDRGDKFASYRKIPSFREYVLVSQHACRIERFFLHSDGHWQFADYAELSATLELGSIPGLKLNLADIYEGVALDAG